MAEFFDAVLAEMRNVTIRQNCGDDIERRAFLAIATRLQSAHDAEVAERDKLRAFAFDVMEDWNQGDLDGGTRQDLAVKHGLLVAVERFGPCGEDCGCSEYHTEEDWKLGQDCYRASTLLTGRPESDATIDAFLSEQAGERENGDG